MMLRAFRVASFLLIAIVSTLAIQPAGATPYPDSIVQVGAWRLGAYTRGQETSFQACSINRVQDDGFAVWIGQTAGGVMGLTVEAPGWALTANQAYAISFTVGSRPFTFNARSVNTHAMSVQSSPEFFTELRSSAALTATANQRHFTMSLDGIQTALDRLKDCVKQYAGRTLTASAQTTPSTPSTNRLYIATGFHIDPYTVITNFHVVNGCTQLGLFKNGTLLSGARQLAVSAGDDLNAIRSEKPSKAFLKLRTEPPIKAAEPVMVFGYPMVHSGLSSGGNTTLGNVTALTGLRDDRRYIQISAAMQPGHSGGPVLDTAGRVMGIATGSLAASRDAQATGRLPQNVNFAIRASTLTGFLNSNRIPYQTDVNAVDLPETERAERAEAASVLLACRR
jgi:S1-C subfamily serine protease